MPETNRPSTGTTSPCLTEQQVAGRTSAIDTGRERAVLVAVGAARSAFDRCGELPMRAGVREVLEGPSGRER